jgi:glycosyltransferase involved in cell wall biosynthesis
MVNILHTVASLHEDEGGPSRTVAATGEALSEAGAIVEIVTTDAGGSDQALAPPPEKVTTTFAPSSPPLVSAYRFSQAVENRIGEQEADVVHDHGVWLPTNYASYRAARRTDRPLVVTTRGMLQPWALNHHRWRKRAAWYAFQRRVLHTADLLHATADAEACQLRRLGLDVPITVVPNGVSIPDTWKQSCAAGTSRRALFLSRIHPKKGLLNLVDAWAAVRPDGWELLIVGPDENNHRSDVETRIHEHNLNGVARVRGPVADDDKWDVYRQSDLFLLPTFSENFGVVVAEALASGIPAITTTGAPWETLETHDCGWWIEPEQDALERALREAVQLSDADRLAMGERGRRLVEEQFTWPAAAEKLLQAYGWLLEGGDPPPHVWAAGETPSS